MSIPGQEHARAAGPDAEILDLDAAGCAAPPAGVIRAAARAGTISGRCTGGRTEQRARLSGLRTALAQLLGCDATGVLLAESATIAFRGLLAALNLRPGDAVALTRLEFGVSYRDLARLSALTGLDVHRVGVDADGAVDLCRIVDLVHNTRLRAFFVPAISVTGARVTNLAAVSRLLADTSTLLVVDGAQALGHVALTAQAVPYDVLYFTGRKYLRGPRATGGVAVRPKAWDELERANRPALAADPRLTIKGLLETREKDPAAFAGMHAAAAHLTRLGITESTARIQRNADRLRRRLGRVPWLSAYSGGGVSGIVCVRAVSDRATQELAESLGRRGVAVAVIDPIRAPLEMNRTGGALLIRMSPHYYITDDQIRRAVDILESLVPRGGEV